MEESPEQRSEKLELYKLAVEMADRTSARRGAANTYFVSLQSVLAVVAGFLGSVGPDSDQVGQLMVAGVGLTLSSTWWLLLRYYRRLNQAKFDVINRIEAHLSVQIFTDEWKTLHPDEVAPASGDADQSRLQKWFKKNHHREASLVEQIIPVVFGVIYVIVGVRAIAS